ncbi:MAG TPA: hypothetical protein VIU62_13660, partial [Chloroflexota bacterium]
MARLMPPSTRRSFLRVSSTVIGSTVAVLLSAACGGTTAATVASSATSSTAAPTAASAAETSSSSAAPLSTTAAATTTSSAVGTAATSTTPAATATATTAAVANPVTAQTFTYWDWWDPVSNPTFAAWFKYVNGAWAQQYPQVALNIVTIPVKGVDDYPNKFIAAVAGNDTPDALHMSVAYARDLWDKGTLLDISSMVARTPSIAADQFIPAAAFYNQADGKIFGTPVEGPSGYGIAYNVAHFQEIGATPTWETTSAWSWQTFADTAAKLVQKDSSGVTRIGYLDSTPSLEYFCEWLYTQGGTFYAPDLKSVQFDQPRGVDALQFTLDLMDRYATSGPLPKGVTNLQYFYQGHISMMPMGLYLINNVHTAAPTLQWDLMPFPKGPAGAGPATDIFVNMD